MRDTAQKYLKLFDKRDEKNHRIDENLSQWKQNIAQRNKDLVPLREPITFSWYQINAYSVRMEGEGTSDGVFSFCSNRKIEKEKQILTNVSGIADPGELFVLMGSSGAGKTTLMNCVTFRNIKFLKVTGLVRVNDSVVTQPELSSQSAYVQQEDLFMPYLTVKEHLIFQAKLRMEKSYTFADKLQRVEDIMTEFSLTKCQHVMIGSPGITKGISGGERKRLALASELITNPSLLFCDEPTTGLDSFMALNVMQTLKSLARSGRTVICTVHQPSSELFGLFDKICLIAEGRTAFLGTLEQAEEFLSKLNVKSPQNFCPGDYYIQLLSIIPGKEEECRKNVSYICDAFEKSTKGINIRRRSRSLSMQPNGKQWENRISSINPYKVNWWQQFRAVLWRCWRGLIMCPELTTHRLLFYSCIIVVLSAIFFHQNLNTLGVHNICGVLFLFLIFLNNKNLSGTVMFFCSELPLFLREHKNGLYRTDVYFLSKCLVDLPLTIIFDILFTSICYVCIGLNHDIGRFFITLSITLIFASTVLGVGYILSIAAPSLAIAQQMLPMLIMPSSMLAGYFLNINSVPCYLQWLADLSWFKWTYMALLINQWSDIKNITCSEELDNCYRNGTDVLDRYGLYGTNIEVHFEFFESMTVLIFMFFVTRVIAFLILLFKSYTYDG